MGCASSVPAGPPSVAIVTSHDIDEKNYDDYKSERRKVKVLLLGAGESGKTTVRKQMNMVYGQGFNDEDKMGYRRHIWANVLEGMKELCEGVQDFGYKRSLQAVAAHEAVMRTRINEPLTPELGQAVKALWADPAIQMAWERRAEIQVIETTVAYFDRVEQLAHPDYLPTIEDIILSRVRSTGIVVEKYVINDTAFDVYDVGGQRNERKKWIHCFDEVDAVIFVAALSEFDQVMFEDDSVNRMVESLSLFDEICNSKWFMSASITLFLNKGDLYREKIQRVSIDSIPCFSDYTGAPNSYEEGIQYFLGKFLALNKISNRQIFHHVTCAIDLNSVQTAFDQCKDVIIQKNTDAQAVLN